MIEELAWDTAFFGRKMGVYDPIPSTAGGVRKVLVKAEAEGYRYLLCKLGGREFGRTRMLEDAGFRLSDIGVTWEMSIPLVNQSPSLKVGIPSQKDIPALGKMTKGLFADSRFYNDPFFTRAEADRLFAKWIENSVKGIAADAVFWIKGAGFITCKRASNKRASKMLGEMPLVGVVEGMRGKGIGRALVCAALEWFRENGIKKARTRTQLINLGAMNFYGRMGFRIGAVDAVMSRVIGQI